MFYCWLHYLHNCLLTRLNICYNFRYCVKASKGIQSGDGGIGYFDATQLWEVCFTRLPWSTFVCTQTLNNFFDTLCT